MTSAKLVLVVSMIAQPAIAADLECNGGLSSADRVIREVRIESTLNTLASAVLPLKKGEILTRDSLGAAEAAVRDRINSEQPSDIANQGGVQVILVRSCVVEVDPTHVDVIITPWTAHVPVYANSVRSLDQPQSGKALLPSNLPVYQRAFNPTFGIRYDRSLKATVRAGFSTSLLQFKNASRSLPDKIQKSDIQLSGDGSRSLDSENYLALAKAGYEYRGQSSTRRIGATVNFMAARQPWGGQARFQNSLQTDANIRIATHGSLLRGVGASLGFRTSDIRTIETDTSEIAGVLRAVFDYRLPFGVGRTSLMSDAGNPTAAHSYARIAIQSGYSGEIPLIAARDENRKKLDATHTLGLELQFTAGKGTSLMPDYAQFRGGSGIGGFVTDGSIDSQLLNPFFAGPILRGYGVYQTAPASSYWGLNINLALPVPKWSRFLIPPERDEDGHTLAERIEGAGLNSSETLMTSYYENEEHLPPDAAAAKAKADIDSVKPAVRFISRYAKLYGLRPLLIFDIAQSRLTFPSSSGLQTLYNGGLGMQFTLVTARAEAGYVWVLGGTNKPPSGNVLFRMTFQNIF